MIPDNITFPDTSSTQSNVDIVAGKVNEILEHLRGSSEPIIEVASKESFNPSLKPGVVTCNGPRGSLRYRLDGKLIKAIDAFL